MRQMLVAAAALGFSCVAGAQTGFWAVGVAPEQEWSWGFGLSQDGRTATGASGLPGSVAYTWTLAGGRDDFGLEPGMPALTSAYALSSDGGVVAGTLSPDWVVKHAFRWTGSGPLEDLGTLYNWPRSHAEDIS